MFFIAIGGDTNKRYKPVTKDLLNILLPQYYYKLLYFVVTRRDYIFPPVWSVNNDAAVYNIIKCNTAPLNDVIGTP